MADYSIYYPSDPNKTDNCFNDNIDVCIRLADGKSYTVVCITPDNLKQQLNATGEFFLPPSFRFLVVEKIDRDIIDAAVKALVSDPRSLRFYGDEPY